MTSQAHHGKLGQKIRSGNSGLLCGYQLSEGDDSGLNAADRNYEAVLKQHRDCKPS